MKGPEQLTNCAAYLENDVSPPNWLVHISWGMYLQTNNILSNTKRCISI